MIKHLPNAITVLNLLLGIVGIIFLWEKNYAYVHICMLLALAADFTDGMVARTLKVSSPLGKQLDSLADNVTFGVLPAMLWYHIMTQLLYVIAGNSGISPVMMPLPYKILPYISLIFAACACLRLAKFNIDERQSTYFIGIPTPAAALFTLGIFQTPLFQVPVWMMMLIMLIISILMVIEIPILSFKMKDKKPIGAVVLITLISIFFFQWLALSISIILLVLFSIIYKNKIIQKPA